LLFGNSRQCPVSLLVVCACVGACERVCGVVSPAEAVTSLTASLAPIIQTDTLAHLYQLGGVNDQLKVLHVVGVSKGELSQCGHQLKHFSDAAVSDDAAMFVWR